MRSVLGMERDELGKLVGQRKHGLLLVMAALTITLVALVLAVEQFDVGEFTVPFFIVATLASVGLIIVGEYILARGDLAEALLNSEKSEWELFARHRDEK